MLDQLINVPGFLKQLKDRLSATWAAKLDTLHDTRLTAPRAGYLDKLNISGVVAGSDEVAAISVVRSIQTGYVSGSGTAGSGEDAQYIDVTISAVTTGKCVVSVQAANTQTSNTPVGPTARLTSTTNVRVSSRIAGSGVSGRWTVLEYK